MQSVFPEILSWDVPHTGDAETDESRGRTLALLYVEEAEIDPALFNALPEIMANMPRPIGAFEIAFLGTLARVRAISATTGIRFSDYHQQADRAHGTPDRP